MKTPLFKITILLIFLALGIGSVYAITIDTETKTFRYTIKNTKEEFITFNSWNKLTREITLTFDVNKTYYSGKIVPIKTVSGTINNSLMNLGTISFPYQHTFKLSDLATSYNQKTYEIHLGKTSASIIIDDPSGDFLVNNSFLTFAWDSSAGSYSSFSSKQAGFSQENRLYNPRFFSTLHCGKTDCSNIITSFGYLPDSSCASITSRVNSGNIVTEIISNDQCNHEKEVFVYKESPCIRMHDQANTTHPVTGRYSWYFDRVSEVTNYELGNGTRIPDGSGVFDYSNLVWYYGFEPTVTDYMMSQIDPMLISWQPATYPYNMTRFGFTTTFGSKLDIGRNLEGGYTGSSLADQEVTLCFMSANTTAQGAKLYYELVEKKGSTCTNTTGTCEIQTGIHFECEPTSEVCELSYAANSTTENNDYQNWRWGNYTTKVVGLYNSTDPTVLITDIAGEITYYYAEDTWNWTDVSKIDCTVGQRVGNYRQGDLKDNNGCNNTLDVFGNPTVPGGFYIWYESFNTGSTEYIVVDGDGNFTFPTAPTVNNVTINSTAPAFYESIRCTATVNDADGIDQVDAVWGNLTYSNGTVLTLQMSNTTQFDWFVDFNTLDFEGLFNCNATAYDTTGFSTLNQTNRTMKSPLEISVISNSTAFELNNETYSITYTDNGFTNYFNGSLIYSGVIEGSDFNTSIAFTKYRNTRFVLVNNSLEDFSFNSSVSFVNGTVHINSTKGNQRIIFGYAIESSSGDPVTLMEGQNFTFVMDDTTYVDYGANLTRYLFYNRTNSTITLFLNGVHYKNTTTGLVNETAKSYSPEYFGWTQIDNGTLLRNVSTTLSHITVNKPILTNCTNTNATQPFGSFRLFDEGNRTTVINGTFHFTFRIFDDQNNVNRVGRFIYDDVTDSTFCGFPAWAKINSTLFTYFWSDNATVLGYESEEFASRNNFLIAHTFTNITTHLDLYSINEEVSREYTLTVKDTDNRPVEGAVVEVSKEFFTEDGGGVFFVAMGLTDIEGRTFINLIDPLTETRPVRYKFRVLKNNLLLKTEEEFYTISATDTTKTIIVQLETFAPYNTVSGGLLANCTEALVGDTGTVTCQIYDTRRILIDNSRLLISRVNILQGNEVVCNEEVANERDFTFPACSLGNVTGNYYTWNIEVQSSGVIVSSGGFFDHTIRGVDWGDTGILMAFLLTLAMVLFGLWHPSFALAMLIVALIVNTAFGFVDWSYSTIVWSIIAISIVLFKGLK